MPRRSGRCLVLTALGLCGALARCDCEPENIGEIRCEYSVDPHDQGAGSLPIDFGAVALGEARTRTVAVRNTGSVQLVDLRFDFSGQNGEHYRLGAALPELTVGGQISVPIVFEPQVVASELNHTVVISHPEVGGVPCSAFTVSVRGGSYEIPELDAGVDAGQDAASADAGEDAGRDAGALVPLPDAGPAFDGGGAFVAVAALQEPRSHCGAAALDEHTVLVGGGLGVAGVALASLEQIEVSTGHSHVVASLPSARSRLVATRMADGRVVFSGGLLAGTAEQALPSDEVVVFTPASATVAVLAATTGVPRLDHAALALDDQELLIAFGETRTAPGQPLQPVGAPRRVFLDARAPLDVTEAEAGAAAPRAEVSATPLGNGRVLFVGGRDATGQALASSVLYENGQLRFTGASLHHPRAGHAALHLGQDLVVVGGVDGAGAPVLAVERLDLSPVDVAGWQFVDEGDAPAVGARYRPHALVLGTELGLVLGGARARDDDPAGPRLARDDAVLLTRLATGTLLFSAPLNHLALPRHRAAVVKTSTGALIAGGTTTSGRHNPQPSLERLDLARGRFEIVGLHGPGSALCWLGDARLLAVGGVDPHTGTASARTRVYDSLDETLADGPALLLARQGAACAPLAVGLVLVAGGEDPSGLVTDSVEFLDLGSGQSQRGVPLVVPRARAGLCPLADGTLLVCGGVGVGGDALDSCEIYDPNGTPLPVDDDSARLVLGFLSTPRTAPQLTPVDADHLLLSDGVDPARGRRPHDLYTVSSGALRAVASLPAVARRHHAAVQVGLGRVLLAGGEVYNGALVATDSAELYDLGTDSYLALPPMLSARLGPAALLFEGGAVLLAGGLRRSTEVPGRPTQALRESELFDPGLGEHGGFVGVALPLTMPRGHAVGLQIGAQPLVVLGVAPDGTVLGGGEHQSLQLSLERYDPEAP